MGISKSCSDTTRDLQGAWFHEDHTKNESRFVLRNPQRQYMVCGIIRHEQISLETCPQPARSLLSYRRVGTALEAHDWTYVLVKITIEALEITRINQNDVVPH